MATVQSVLDALERIAPARTAFTFDKVGLQVGDPGDEVTSAAVALDCTPGLLDFAEAHHCQLVVCHHPIIWDPLKAVNRSTRAGRIVTELIRRKMTFVGVHTNWDTAPNGINHVLAELIGIQNAQPFGGAQAVPHVKMVVFAPAPAAESLIDAMSAAGAGVIGLYERCAFKGEGKGTYIGREGANPAVGQSGRVEIVDEVRIEMRLPESVEAQVVAAMRRVHPYEEPAYDLYPLKPIAERPAGRIGELRESLSPSALCQAVDRSLDTRSWLFGDPGKQVQRVAVCGGAADGEWRAARAAGADLFLTGEVKHDVALEAIENGLAIVAAGHYATEHPGALALGDALAVEMPSVEWHKYEPAKGHAGRLAV